MTPRLALIALMTLPLAACDGANLPGLGRSEPQVRGHQGPPGVSPLEQPIETGGEARPVSTAEAATYNTAAFSARGNEPFWAVDAAGSTAVYKTPDNQNGRPIRVNRLNFAQGVEYVGVHAGRPFVLNIRATECQDSMSGQDFPFTARLTVSGRTETGCAGPASAEVAQAVAATRAPAPAAPRQATRPAATRPAAAPAAAAPAPAEETPAAAPAATQAEPETPTPAPAATTPAPASTPAAPAPAATTPAAPAATAPASEGTADLPPAPEADAAPATPAPAATPAPRLPPAPAAAAPASEPAATPPAE
ncbi:hypothetical protein RAH32_02380 [Paracoccus sp. WLY502]|uniref:COG3650 family protein n=1 Tax=Paracoccus yibinensis TaxID=3068891 RepID=UPI0027967C71|nr:hypothetical protein [Paracoccus sp. WLY502]MDQ1899291.1 hypothetical protein [Paracoccus sp. WLY502]